MTTGTSVLIMLIIKRYDTKPKVSGHCFFFIMQFSQPGQSECSTLLNLKHSIFHLVGEVYVISQDSGNRLICS